MTSLVPLAVFNIALTILVMAMLLCLVRIILGPTVAGRAVAADSMGVAVMAFISIYALKNNQSLYLSAVLVIAVLGFIGLIVASKFISGGDIIDRNSD